MKNANELLLPHSTVGIHAANDSKQINNIIIS